VTLYVLEKIVWLRDEPVAVEALEHIASTQLRQPSRNL
jgi:hypothetical protein